MSAALASADEATAAIEDYAAFTAAPDTIVQCSHNHQRGPRAGSSVLGARMGPSARKTAPSRRLGAAGPPMLGQQAGYAP